MKRRDWALPGLADGGAQTTLILGIGAFAFLRLEARMDRLETRMDRMEERLDNLDRRVARIEGILRIQADADASGRRRAPLGRRLGRFVQLRGRTAVRLRPANFRERGFGPTATRDPFRRPLRLTARPTRWPSDQGCQAKRRHAASREFSADRWGFKPAAIHVVRSVFVALGPQILERATGACARRDDQPAILDPDAHAGRRARSFRTSRSAGGTASMTDPSTLRGVAVYKWAFSQRRGPMEADSSPEVLRRTQALSPAASNADLD